MHKTLKIYDFVRSGIWLSYIYRRPEWILILIQLIWIAPGLAIRPLWLDEAYSALMARKSYSGIHRAMNYDAGPPLYYDLLNMWRLWLGESEAALRALSLFFSMIISILLYRFCLIFLNQRTAWVSTILWILSPISVYYASEARNYTLFTALAFSYFFPLIYYSQNNYKSIVSLSGFKIASSIPILILALYIHNMAWFLIPVGWTVILFTTLKRKALLSITTANAISVIAYLPWIPTFQAQMQNTEMTIGWVRQAWSYKAVWETINAFIPGGKSPVYLDLVQFSFPVQVFNILLTLGLVIYVLLRIHNSVNPSIRMILIVLISGLFFPYLYSILQNPIYLAGRTDFFLFPWWCIILGYGISSISKKLLRYGILSLLIVEMMGLNFLNLTRVETYSEKDVITYINRHAEPGEVIVCTGLTRPTLEYYLEKKKLIFLSYPSQMADHLAHLNERWFIQNHNIHQCVLETVNQIKILSKSKRFWVVGSERPINRPILELLHSDKNLIVNRIQTPTMGLRKLEEPIFLERCEYQP